MSEIAWTKTDKVEDVLKVGQEVDVKLLEIDPKTGKMRLSMRALTEKPEGYVEPKPRERGPRREGGERREGARREGGERREGRGPRREGGERREGRPERREERRPRHEEPKHEEPDVF